MGTIDELRQWLQDAVLPELREIKGRIDGLDKRLDGMEKRMDRIEQGFSDLRSEVVKHLLSLEADLRQFYRSLGQHDARLDNLEKQ